MNEELVIPEALFVIGNGFDLQCNLKSTYEDFLYSKLKDYGEEIGKIPFADNVSIQSTLDYYIEDLAETLEVLKSNGKQNVFFEKLSAWYIILLGKKMLMNNDWCYIENQIHEMLRQRSDDISPIEDIGSWILEDISGRENTHRDRDTYIYKLVALNMQLKYREIFELVLELGGSCDIDCQSLLKASDERLVTLIVEKLLLELNELEKDFGKYLYKAVNQLADYSERSERLFRIMLDNMRVERPIKYNVLSFNYTRPWFQGSNRVINELVKYVNIHGHIEPNGGKIVFGIDESEINPNSSQYIFTKVSRTLGLYNQQQSNMDIPINELLSEGIKRVIFYGHSLSIADYGYFKMIFDRYKDEETQFEFYYNVYEGTTEEKEYRKQVNAISRLFGIYSREKFGQSNIFQEMVQNKRILIKKI